MNGARTRGTATRGGRARRRLDASRGVADERVGIGIGIGIGADAPRARADDASRTSTRARRERRDAMIDVTLDARGVRVITIDNPARGNALASADADGARLAIEYMQWLCASRKIQPKTEDFQARSIKVYTNVLITHRPGLYSTVR